MEQPPIENTPSPEGQPGMRAILIGPPDNGEGVYFLLAENGEALYQHFCSEAAFAEDDLVRNRSGRAEQLREKGITSFVWLQDSGLTKEELMRRNREFNERKTEEKK